ncbi:hypothetical protein RO3G_07733 [Rhizopus delemar RA 99-880]|uniref:Uncharacterized protein n=1 Tax=Rhizopus delemar (strain RA 99-880 / ATCC MYA-4621 / FGSC 9543 / NRRL 43880) TaxID=246409 RepID=I1C3D6_RHIO9|nr:hypothetical protein RO3G_07671 [Rhizopus delemar RA 99-880]EIE83028.1 hypothetical protein RO3G_07733 [Rhizopus delemar RA 99-880]|eukprot:EIE82966.1 hypothetical protein RO3G_07671 [Rhizopus delemar RA 99-880]
MSQTASCACNLCKFFIGAIFAKLQLHQICGGSDELSLKISVSETTLSDDVVDNDANIYVDLEVGMESVSSVIIEPVASSLHGNKKIQVVIPDHH